MSEEILGRIEVADKWDNLLNLVFTSNRIIIARLVSGLGTALRGVTLGTLGWALTRREKGEKREEYGRLSTESILKADKKNFAIPYVGIIKIEMKKPGTFSGGKIKIFTSDKTHEFTFKEKKELFDERVNLVRSVLPDKLSLT